MSRKQARPRQRGMRTIGIVAITTSTSMASAREQGEPTGNSSMEQLVAEQLEAVRANLDALCWPACGSVVLDVSEATAAAEEEHLAGGMARVAYNARFMSGMLRRYGSSVVFAVLAHEYGHHLDRLSYGSDWTRELRADAVAGCALARRGDPLGPTLQWMRDEHFYDIAHEVFKDPCDPAEGIREYTNRHPWWTLRIEALSQGAELCSGGEPPLLALFFGKTPADELGAGAPAALVFGAEQQGPPRETSALETPRRPWASQQTLYVSFTAQAGIW